MSEVGPEQQDTGGTIWDAPNQQVVGLDPPWVEGTGGDPGPGPQLLEQWPEPPPEGGPQATAYAEPEELNAMTKAELLAYAQQIGVSPANNDMTKDEIRAGIDAHQAR